MLGFSLYGMKIDGIDGKLDKQIDFLELIPTKRWTFIAMLIVKITMHSLPEKRKEVLQTLLSMIEETRKEKGCRSYKVLQCIEDENVFCLVQEWETREDLENYIRSEKFGVLMGAKILLNDKQDIQVHTVLHTEGDGIVSAVRAK